MNDMNSEASEADIAANDSSVGTFADTILPSIDSETVMDVTIGIENTWPMISGAETTVIRFSDGIYVMGSTPGEIVAWYQSHFISSPGAAKICSPTSLAPGHHGITLGEMARTVAEICSAHADNLKAANQVTAPLVPFVLTTDQSEPACFMVTDPERNNSGSEGAWGLIMDNPEQQDYTWDTIEDWMRRGAVPTRLTIRALIKMLHARLDEDSSTDASGLIDLDAMVRRAQHRKQAVVVHVDETATDACPGRINAGGVPAVMIFKSRHDLEGAVAWMADRGWLQATGDQPSLNSFRTDLPEGPAKSTAVHRYMRVVHQCKAGSGHQSAESELKSLRQILAEAGSAISSLTDMLNQPSVPHWRVLSKVRIASRGAIRAWDLGDGPAVAAVSAEAAEKFVRDAALPWATRRATALALHMPIHRPGRAASINEVTYAQKIEDMLHRGVAFPALLIPDEKPTN